MITPRRTRLVRVPDLQAFRHAITECSLRFAAARDSRLVVVPTGGAARQLLRSLGSRQAPAVVTRDQLYDRLHGRLDATPARLSAYDRDAMMASAARDAAAALGTTVVLRPGLIAEILRFYDQLRRQARNVGRFEELLDEALSRDAEHDRGAERMLAHARFMAATFQGYERQVSASGACDEHELRERLIDASSSRPVREIIVTVADWIADPSGLYLSDFDLLTRLPGLEEIEVVATEGLLGSGFHQRIHDWLPGIEEVEGGELGIGRATGAPPILMTPDAESGRFVFVRRDREEELIAIARRMTAEAPVTVPLERIAVVFKRPLPYLYLAREVFGQAGLPYQAFDALPLAAEPFAAALDLVFEFVESGFTRSATVALLRSPHFAFGADRRRIDRGSIAALDQMLSEQRYLGTLERLTEFAATSTGTEGVTAAAALQAAQEAALALVPLAAAAPASGQFQRLIMFLDAHSAEPRDRGGRAAVREVLTALAAAHAAHNDQPIEITGMAASVRRWIEEQTFQQESSGAGVQLLDDQAARYGEFEDLALVGLIEGEWPEKSTRNIFYPASLLASLGWPTEKDRRAAAEVRFLELLRSPLRRTFVSTVSLDDEALVEPSTFVDEIPNARLSVKAIDDPAVSDVDLKHDQSPDTRVEAYAAHAGQGMLEFEGTDHGASDADEQTWLSIRQGRTPADNDAFHGQVAPLSSRAWSISGLETYLGCPFKFFAQHVLKLAEEPDDEEVMDPRRQGQFVHDVFETFFKRWQDEGNGTITPGTIDAARALFREVVEASLVRFSDTEASLERTRLLGSSAAAGLGEAVFRMEAERPVPVVDRLLESRLKGEFAFQTAQGPRRLSLSGKADRIDLLADGTFRVIDYKLGWPPNKARALQLPIYGLCAEQNLEGHLGRHWTFGEAAYLAFKGPKRVVALFASDDERATVLADAQQRLVDTVDGISAGRFPPTPDDVFRCETCTYAAVCRKDYVGDV